MEVPLVTWSEQGVSFSETRASLPERSQAECAAAFRFFCGADGLSASQIRAFAGMAARHQSTRLILDEVEAPLRASLLEGCPALTPRDLDIRMELYGLFVEAFVRVAASIQRQCTVLEATSHLYPSK